MFFILDDSLERINIFERYLGKDNIDYALNATDAIEKLRSNSYDCIFLDHDLGGGAYLRGEDGDGIDVVKVMVEEGLQLNTSVIIHSMNFGGAQNMYNELRKDEDRTNDIRIIDFSFLVSLFNEGLK